MNQNFLWICTSTHYVIHYSNYKVSRNFEERFQRSCADKKNRTDGLIDGRIKNIIPSATGCVGYKIPGSIKQHYNFDAFLFGIPITSVSVDTVTGKLGRKSLITISLYPLLKTSIRKYGNMEQYIFNMTFVYCLVC